MKIIDRYILTKFFKTFFFVVILLNIIVCIVDYTEKSDDFIREDVPAAEIFFDYYVNFFIHMANTLSPISIFISAVFVTARMAAHSEIIAFQSAGISFKRLLVPYLVGSILLGAATFYLVGWVIPDAAKTKVAFQVKYLKGPYYFDERNIHLKVDDTTYIYMESFMNRSKTGYKFTMENIHSTKLHSKLSADKIVWDSLSQKWFIPTYKVHTFDGDKEVMSRGSRMDTSLNVTPEYFESRYLHNETMTISELDRFIAQERARGQYNVGMYLHEKYERFSYPFAIVILTLMGVVVSSRKTRQGSGLQIAIGFFLACLFILFVIMSRSIGAAGSMPPHISAWLPIAVFTVVSGLMLFTFKK